jgi:hypothetical protein
MRTDETQIKSITGTKQLAKYQSKFGCTPTEIQCDIQSIGHFQTIGDAFVARHLQVANSIEFIDLVI